MGYDKETEQANRYTFKWSLANGKKYLINYPKELLEQTPDIHVYKPKLKLKWRVGRVVAVISITAAFIALIALLFEGMFVEFFVLLLVTVFLLLPFGLSDNRDCQAYQNRGRQDYNIVGLAPKNNRAGQH